MPIKAILVPVEDEDLLDNVLDAALVVARRFCAHIAVLHISESALQSAMYANMSGEVKKWVQKEEQRILLGKGEGIQKKVDAYAREKQIIQADQRQDGDEVTISFHHEYGDKRSALVHWARLFDTTAVMRPQPRAGTLGRRLYGDDLETILLHSGRPILIVPPEWDVHRARHAVIAWNHSLEASRALAMTLPWLVQMEKVTVVVSRGRRESGEQVVHHLEWHGANVELEILNRRTTSAGRRLLKICDNKGADFLVMGGYSHSRMQEHVLGGVTDYVLRHSKIITVMVH